MFKPLPQGLERYVISKESFFKTEHVSIYKGCDKVVKREVAIKMIKSDEETINVIIHQTKQLSTLQENINIFPVLDQFRSDDNFFIVTPIAEIGNLTQMLEVGAKKITYKQKLQITFQLVDALLYLHSHNVLHMNIKPENIMFSEYDKSYLVQLSDVGLALSYCEHFDQTYLAPEVRDSLDFTKAGDIFSLGCVLYQLFYGQNYLTVGDEGKVVVNEKPVSEETEIDSEIELMIKQMLLQDPANRGEIGLHRKEIVALTGESDKRGLGCLVIAFSIVCAAIAFLFGFKQTLKK